MPYTLRSACPRCSEMRGFVTVTGPHYKVTCLLGHYCYFAPKDEVLGQLGQERLREIPDDGFIPGQSVLGL